jgi:hypothetical protein
MNPPLSYTVAGDLITMWRRIEAVNIVHPVKVTTHPRELTDPRLFPTRYRLSRRSRVLVARDHVKSSPGKDDNSLFHPFFR